MGCCSCTCSRAFLLKKYLGGGVCRSKAMLDGKTVLDKANTAASEIREGEWQQRHFGEKTGPGIR